MNTCIPSSAATVRRQFLKITAMVTASVTLFPRHLWSQPERLRGKARIRFAVIGIEHEQVEAFCATLAPIRRTN